MHRCTDYKSRRYNCAVMLNETRMNDFRPATVKMKYLSQSTVFANTHTHSKNKMRQCQEMQVSISVTVSTSSTGDNAGNSQTNKRGGEVQTCFSCSRRKLTAILKEAFFKVCRSAKKCCMKMINLHRPHFNQLDNLSHITCS